MFHCLPNSAWADWNLAEVAVQLGKTVEHPNQSQLNPGPRADESPCSCDDKSRTDLNLNYRLPLSPEFPESTAIFGLFVRGPGGRPGPLLIPDDPDTEGDDLADAAGLALFWSSPVSPLTQSSSATARKLFRSFCKQINQKQVT